MKTNLDIVVGYRAECVCGNLPTHPHYDPAFIERRDPGHMVVSIREPKTQAIIDFQRHIQTVDAKPIEVKDIETTIFRDGDGTQHQIRLIEIKERDVKE